MEKSFLHARVKSLQGDDAIMMKNVQKLVATLTRCFNGRRESRDICNFPYVTNVKFLYFYISYISQIQL